MPVYERPITALIIEDQPHDADLLVEAIQSLTQAPVRIHRAETLVGAKHALQSQSFDLVTLDLFLPNSQPLETWWELRPILGIDRTLIASAYLDHDLLLTLIHSGARWFWSKIDPVMHGRSLVIASVQVELMRVITVPPSEIPGTSMVPVAEIEARIRDLHHNIEQVQYALYRGNGHSILTKMALVENRIASIDDKLEDRIQAIERKLDTIQPAMSERRKAELSFRGTVIGHLTTAGATILVMLLGWVAWYLGIGK